MATIKISELFPIEEFKKDDLLEVVQDGKSRRAALSQLEEFIGSELPAVTEDDAGDLLQVDENGKWNKSTLINKPNGIAPLDDNGKVPSENLPSYVDDIVEGYKLGNKFYKDAEHTEEIILHTGVIYVDLTTDPVTLWRYTSEGHLVELPRNYQANWNQNNPESEEYVKNRTHYIDDNGVVHKLSIEYIDTDISINGDSTNYKVPTSKAVYDFIKDNPEIPTITIEYSQMVSKDTIQFTEEQWEILISDETKILFVEAPKAATKDAKYKVLYKCGTYEESYDALYYEVDGASSRGLVLITYRPNGEERQLKISEDYFPYMGNAHDDDILKLQGDLIISATPGIDYAVPSQLIQTIKVEWSQLVSEDVVQLTEDQWALFADEGTSVLIVDWSAFYPDRPYEIIYRDLIEPHQSLPMYFGFIPGSSLVAHQYIGHEDTHQVERDSKYQLYWTSIFDPPTNGDMVKVETDQLTRAVPNEDYALPTVHLTIEHSQIVVDLEHKFAEFTLTNEQWDKFLTDGDILRLSVEFEEGSFKDCTFIRDFSGEYWLLSNGAYLDYTKLYVANAEHKKLHYYSPMAIIPTHRGLLSEGDLLKCHEDTIYPAIPGVDYAKPIPEIVITQSQIISSYVIKLTDEQWDIFTDNNNMLLYVSFLDTLFVLRRNDRQFDAFDSDRDGRFLHTQTFKIEDETLHTIKLYTHRFIAEGTGLTEGDIVKYSDDYLEKAVPDVDYVKNESDPIFTASPASSITSSDITAWNNKSDFSGDYEDLTNKPSIPTKTSDLTNDSDFVSDADYVHTDNNFTSIEKSKLADIENGAEVNDVNDIQINGTSIVNNTVANIEIKDNTISTDTNKPLSANMGKELQDQINNLKSRGRFLSLWNATTGLAMSVPTVNPYEYRTGDYFLIEIVGTTNYRPNGTTYDKDVPSTTIETEAIAQGDVYIYDGTTWILQKNTQTEITFSNIGGSPFDNSNLANALNNKVEDVQINGVSITSNRVANVPYASSNQGGVVKTGAARGTEISNGVLQAGTRTYEQYQTDNDALFIGKRTLENIITGKELENKVNDIQINGTSIIDANKVANIPIGSTSTAGVLRADTSYGTRVDNTYLRAVVRTYSQYGSDSVNMFIGKGTLENVIAGKAIKSTWTGTQAQYDALTTFDDNTDYRIVED